MWRPRRPDVLRWDHNARFHPWLLARLPPRVDRALDVGCGTGTLARLLAAQAARVDAVDRSDAMIGLARQVPGGDGVTWLVGDVLAIDLPPAAYDVVTAVASLHHLPLEAGLERLGSLVRPGGSLVVVGLARSTSWRDLLLDAVSVVADPVVGAVLAVRRPRRAQDPVPPLRDPRESFEDVVAAAGRLLPGSEVRRHLFYRYTLWWTRPSTS